MSRCNPYVSVIMAAFNAEKTVVQSAESVLAQSFGDLQLIIVDDCSTDNTSELVRALAAADDRITVIRNEENKGIIYSRNRAVEAAEADWIAICDSDDLWTEDKLEKQLARQRETDASLIYTGSSFIDADSNPMKWSMNVPESIGYRKLRYQNVISNSSVLVDKSLFIKYRTSDDRVHEDYACWLRMLMNGIKACGVDEPLLIYRVSKGSRTGNKLKSAIRTWRTYRYVGMDLFECICSMSGYTVKSLIKYIRMKG